LLNLSTFKIFYNSLFSKRIYYEATFLNVQDASD